MTYMYDTSLYDTSLYGDTCMPTRVRFPARLRGKGGVAVVLTSGGLRRATLAEMRALPHGYRGHVTSFACAWCVRRHLAPKLVVCDYVSERGDPCLRWAPHPEQRHLTMRGVKEIAPLEQFRVEVNGVPRG